MEWKFLRRESCSGRIRKQDGVCLFNLGKSVFRNIKRPELCLVPSKAEMFCLAGVENAWVKGVGEPCSWMGNTGPRGRIYIQRSPCLAMLVGKSKRE